MRIVRWILIGLGVLVLLLGLFAAERFWTLSGSLPDLEGEITAPGLGAPVEIIRDRHGIPHIEAQNLDDALYGLGLVHAQDRLWQMTLLRRIGQGRTAEVFGSFALEADRNLRALGLAPAAQASLETLDPASRRALQAYAAGVNAIITAQDRPWPPEFFLTQTTPEPWAPVDSVMLLNMLSLGLSANAFNELGRVTLSGHLTPEQVAQIMAPMPGLPADFDADAFRQTDTTDAAQELAGHMLELRGASNNWVVDGQWTADGEPLLANDPHLGLTMPSVWYLAHLKFGGRNAMGGTMAGIPSVLIGQTDDIAWGLTTTGADVQDLVLERLEGDQYLTPAGPRAFETREETIRVRFGETVTQTIRLSRNGPLLPLLEEMAPEGHAYALKWTALSPENRTVDASLAILRARSAPELLDALEDYASPVQSLVYADRQGATGFIVAGALPVRHPDVGDGTVPVKGWEHETIWTGLLPASQAPRLDSPASGYALTANHDIRPPGYPHLVTRDWRNTLRDIRIENQLTATRAHTVASFEALQLDERTGLKDTLLPVMLAAVTPSTEKGRTAVARLTAWDGGMGLKASEPLLMAAWMRALAPLIATDELGDLADRFNGLRPDFFTNVLSNRDGQAVWCDDTSTGVTETCADLLDQALIAAIDEVEAEYGADWDAWRWGDAHTAIHSHLPFGFVPGLRALFSRAVESPGGSYTVNRGVYRLSGTRPYANVSAGGYRAVFKLTDLSRSTHMIATGQSGNPYSPFYDSFVADWAAGRFTTIAPDRETYAQDAAGVLRLIPQSGDRLE